LVNAVLARRAPQALRLAVLYASLDQQPQIAVPHLEAALAIIRYCTESARLVFGAAPATGDDVADQILDALHQRPHTRTELIGLFARHVNRDRLTRALGLLARHKLARPTRTPTRGRPRETWTAI
jgi:hypothetical protein